MASYLRSPSPRSVLSVSSRPVPTPRSAGTDRRSSWRTHNSHREKHCRKSRYGRPLGSLTGSWSRAARDATSPGQHRKCPFAINKPASRPLVMMCWHAIVQLGPDQGHLRPDISDQRSHLCPALTTSCPGKLCYIPTVLICSELVTKTFMSTRGAKSFICDLESKTSQTFRSSESAEPSVSHLDRARRRIKPAQVKLLQLSNVHRQKPGPAASLI
ncbi:hypothetical protein RRG08_057622 [Elysia crispata]|uniref:Uncharacterized protein n=1 Tax=Elysia crispata TaxID=231223 RepID=A0AAE1DR52_9GAST|nr:hypothetical protein RRG08_057622 [Elysia crispata]